jgi:CDP-diacylglycerol--glycerol-3-phosphate 3-phosphatidyltransferase
MLNVAHALTLFRLFISPLFSILYLGYSNVGMPLSWVPYCLLGLLLLSELSDFYDGFWARKHRRVTDLGKVLDPMADSLTHLTLFLSFTQGVIALPLLIVLIFLYRDFLVSTLRTLCALKGFALAARKSGKIKAVVQGACLVCIIICFALYTADRLSLQELQTASCLLVVITAGYTLFSLVDYLVANRDYLRRAIGG